MTLNIYPTIKSAFIKKLYPNKMILCLRMGIYEAINKNYKLLHLYELERDD
jgi:hypothetical protein